MIKRFFLPPQKSLELLPEKKLSIQGELFDHIVKSMRMREGDKLILLDGEGSRSKGRIENISHSPEKVEIKLLNVEKSSENEPETDIYLAQALAKKDKVETVLQKGTEIGVRGFIPFTSRHTVVKLNEKKKKKRWRRWRKIIKEAARQSERDIIPELKPLHSLKDFVKLAPEYDTICLALAREARYSIKDLVDEETIKSGDRLLLTVGPEGGFSDSEVKQMLAVEGCYDLGVGPRIMRTETAGPLISGIILHELGEMQ